MRWPHLLVSLCLLMPASALAAGPVISGGVLGVDIPAEGHGWSRGMGGASYKVAFEVGQRFRSEFSFGQAVLGNSDDIGQRRLSLSGFGYQLSFHLFPKGFSPYIGLGVEMGAAVLESEPYDSWYSDVDEGPFLRAHAVAGIRWQMRCGLGLRAEISRATYGQFLTWQHNLGISYTY